MKLIFIVAGMDYGIELNFVNLRNCANVTGHGTGDFNTVLPLQSIKMCKLEPFAPVPDKYLVAGLTRPWCTRNTPIRPM